MTVEQLLNELQDLLKFGRLAPDDRIRMIVNNPEEGKEPINVPIRSVVPNERRGSRIVALT